MQSEKHGDEPNDINGSDEQQPGLIMLYSKMADLYARDPRTRHLARQAWRLARAAQIEIGEHSIEYDAAQEAQRVLEARKILNILLANFDDGYTSEFPNGLEDPRRVVRIQHQLGLPRQVDLLSGPLDGLNDSQQFFLIALRGITEHLRAELGSTSEPIDEAEVVLQGREAAEAMLSHHEEVVVLRKQHEEEEFERWLVELNTKYGYLSATIWGDGLPGQN